MKKTRSPTSRDVKGNAVPAKKSCRSLKSLHSLQETNASAYRAPGILQLHLGRRSKGRGSKRENMENVKG